MEVITLQPNCSEYTFRVKTSDLSDAQMEIVKARILARANESCKLNLQEFKDLHYSVYKSKLFGIEHWVIYNGGEGNAKEIYQTLQEMKIPYELDAK